MRALLFIICLFVFKSSFAQDLTFPKVDTLTYNAFLKNDFKTIKTVGNKALKKNIDFYYLRYRMGIASFQMKNFVDAAKHFEKAYATDNSDSQLREYLYFSYTYSGQKEKATILADHFSKEEKEKIQYKPSILESISIVAGLLKSNNYKANFNNKDFISPSPYGQGTIYNDVHYENLTLNIRIAPKLRWTNYGSFASNSYYAIIQNNFPTFSSLTTEDTTNYYQWNSVLNYFTKGWNFAAGGGGYYSTYYTYFTDLINPNLGILKDKFTQTNYSGSLSISKNLHYFVPKLEATYSNFSDKKNYTTELGVTVFPFGNLNFYCNSKVDYLKNETNKNLIYSQLIGCKIFSKLWIEMFGSHGNHENFIADNGLLSFNTPNKINWYAGTNLNFYFKKFDVTLGYVLQQREGNYDLYTNPNTYTTTTYNFNYNLIKTKITWKF